MEITPFDLAQRFVGIKELPGEGTNNPFIMSMLRLDASWPQSDEVPWCSAFVNYIAWLMRLPRSKDLRARSWLEVGTPVDLEFAHADSDVIIIARGTDPQQGHVGFFAGATLRAGQWKISILGGNQGDTVSVSTFTDPKILGIRRLA